MTNKKGWYGESHRHSLASRGIRTKIKERTEMKDFQREIKQCVPEKYSLEEGTTQRAYAVGTAWSRGGGGTRDYKKRANITLPATGKNHSIWNPQKNKMDLNGVDTPRKDLKVVRTCDISIYIGGDNKREIAFTERILRKALTHFTNEEIKDMDNIYIDSSGSFKKISGIIDHARMNCYEFNENKGSAVILNEDITPLERHELTLVHELVHALRFGRGKRSKSVVREEKLTELEAIGRTDMSKCDINDIGYYSFNENRDKVIGFQGAIHDKSLLTDDITKKLKGKTLSDKVEKSYNKSYIKNEVKINVEE